jgi:hypothetical protein
MPKHDRQNKSAKVAYANLLTIQMFIYKLYLRLAEDSILDATFTVSPNKQ